ncbi:MAG: phospho-N-acetylmuramoyl-pentapeptide-transferase [Bacillus thermozeamaize]|jgi:phospho-N-acetylmuramoyl-pentapeptide-transferase|uniref:Phospho-N-acetylmuramoyl-pentapeptide-transferase n=1 Tax=Bacillus thermozeamaize TaxID=230954 RepID=A0A1Y3PK82_9BACI|nr:MAG: phospho-N-acetylmuramoyl-pentapeptide-transferase [Bacillus thermozeamaize]
MEIRPLILTVFAAFMLAVFLSPLMIPLLRRLKFGQYIREDGPKGHQKKAGTPTMGGLMIMLPAVLATFLFADFTPTLSLLLLSMLGYGLIGFLDDFIKVVMKRNLGLTATQKLFLQLLLALSMYLLLQRMDHPFTVSVPGTQWEINLGWSYFLLLVLINLATTNAVNLTDGLDGLLAGTAGIAFATYGIIAWVYMKPEIALFSCAMMGAVLGFLVFNAHPAKVFMGDTGSLAIGGALAAIAIMTKTELLLIVIGGVFVIEALSVIIQVISYKTRKKRVFKMSPIHHHFELSGWSEWRVVVTFWLISFVFAGVGLYLGVLV